MQRHDAKSYHGEQSKGCESQAIHGDSNHNPGTCYTRTGEDPRSGGNTWACWRQGRRGPDREPAKALEVP